MLKFFQTHHLARHSPKHTYIYKKNKIYYLYTSSLCHVALQHYSSFSNTLGATDHPAQQKQQKALIAAFKEEFDSKPEDVLQHIAAFHHWCKESGVTEDFKFIKEEHIPPSDVDMTDAKQKQAWLNYL